MYTPHICMMVDGFITIWKNEGITFSHWTKKLMLKSIINIVLICLLVCFHIASWGTFKRVALLLKKKASYSKAFTLKRFSCMVEIENIDFTPNIVLCSNITYHKQHQNHHFWYGAERVFLFFLSFDWIIIIKNARSKIN